MTISRSGKYIPARMELKYVIPESMAQEVAASVRAYYQRDQNTEGTGTEYVVTSLYLDTPDLLFYKEKMQHQRTRLKLRVRTYGPLNDGPYFAEIKRRFGDVISKTRARVPEERWPELLRPKPGSGPESWGMSSKNQRAAIEFQGWTGIYRAQPTVVIRYNREAYVGLYHPDLRLTFDRRLRFAAVSTPLIPSNERDYRPADFGSVMGIREPGVVLEIKYNDRFPVPLADLARRFELRRQSFSKYCSAVTQMLEERTLYRPDMYRSTLA